jgi:hypothetical protein
LFAAMRLTAALPLTDAARTGRPVWLTDRTTALQRYPLLAPVLLADTHALAALPLLAGERLVGALGVTFTRPRPFDEDERGFLLTVAGQVAVAFERATLADARREMAETLQRTLLPGELPELKGVAVTARYLPAVEGTRAGGDWYDVLAVDGGRVALVVGDVVGHGAPAAAVMGQLRAGPRAGAPGPVRRPRAGRPGQHRGLPAARPEDRPTVLQQRRASTATAAAPRRRPPP